MTSQQLIQLLNDYAEVHGAEISRTLFLNLTGLTDSDILEHFLTWDEFRLAAGFEVSDGRRRLRVSQDDILNALRELVKTHGDQISLQMFIRESGISEKVIYARFGSWRNVRVAVGLDADVNRSVARISRDDVLADLMQVYERTGTTPVLSHHRRNGGQISVSTITRIFGAWGNVLEAFEEYRLAARGERQAAIEQVGDREVDC